ncbi:MAG: hypothetical protein CMM49_08005 [Rhodospirillaceae bacterium]|nr:hypothetical protein [Rhodospirillaceae bacterium]|tara:strand:+ start:2352 stop:3170 length:819 start_codon:yes stop_codon:yes gene_type:complete
MLKLNYIIFLFCSSILLYSCSNNNLNSTKIIPTFQNEKEIKNKNKTSKIYFLGLALWGNGEEWSENDIIDLEKIFRDVYFNRKFNSFIFSNKGIDSKNKLPYFSEKKLEILIKNISDLITEKDIIIITISSHGFPGGVTYRIGITPSAPILGDRIQEILRPIKENNILIIISSCYSGSLIDSLKGTNRIIFTAASADKPSFGCDKESKNSWFIESLNESYYKHLNTKKRFSLKKWFNETKNIVKKKEERLGYPHSFPQIFIGKNANPFVFLL